MAAREEFYITGYQTCTENVKYVKTVTQDPEVTPETQKISAYAHGAQYSPGRMRFLIAMWVACRYRPFQIVEDPEFREICKMLYNKVDLPSRHTVSRDVRDIHERAKANVLKLFKVRTFSHVSKRVSTLMFW